MMLRTRSYVGRVAPFIVLSRSACRAGSDTRRAGRLSPDGRYVATIRREADGVVVEVWPARGVLWPWYGAVFRAQPAGRASSSVAPASPPPVEVRWRAGAELEVAFDPRLRPGLRAGGAGPVRVRYVTFQVRPPAVGPDPYFRQAGA
jgi:hypothetical protein